MEKRIIVASRNRNKVEEIKTILDDTGYSVISLEETGINVNVVEDGATFEANAYKKAFEVMQATGETVLADDSGLVVDALDGKPGVYSARFAGEGASDEDNNRKLLELMQDIPGGERRARFVCAVVVVFPDGTHIQALGECHGQILLEPRGNGGFGYDPLFYVAEHQKTFAELKPEEKNAISHRSKALHKIKCILKGPLKGEKG